MTDNIYVLVVGAMIGVFCIVFFMVLLQAKAQNKLLRQKKIAAEREIEHQRELARLLIVSQEHERKRIGMDLHDEVGTVLSALRMHLEKMAEADNPDHLATLNVAGKKSIDNIIRSVRKISHNLSPFMKGAYELRDGIEDLAEQVTTSGALAVSLNFNDFEKFGCLAEESQLALYRILSELVNNTIKHAEATTAQVLFSKTDALLAVAYSDNGKGLAKMDKGKRGIGMANIESRCNAMNAAWAIAENKGQGFEIEIKIPISA